MLTALVGLFGTTLLIYQLNSIGTNFLLGVSSCALNTA